MFKRLLFLAVIFFLFSIFLFAQESESSDEVPEITVITINNARQTSYKKSEETGNDTIVLEGSVSLSVEKGKSKNEITADKVLYDRKTEMLYAEGNVEIIMSTDASGGDKATAKSILLNTSTLEGVFDGGRVVQTQSDSMSLPSGSTLIVYSEIFGKGNQNVITFKNSSLTFCDEEEPHWHIDSTRTWLLPGGEFAFFNALLYVGVVPVFYFPAFYYPKDELIFNPVFNYRKREGYSVQTTTYLYGRKPLDKSSSSGNSTSTSSADSFKAVYNFIRPNTLKEQVREGLVLHNLDEDYKGDTSHYVKIMADWYMNLGYMVGLDGKITPLERYIPKLDFELDLGFSNTVFKNSSDNLYHPYSKTGREYQDTSNLLGLKLPFRYGANLQLQISKPVSLSISMPVYSDPYFNYDFKTNRKESMDWISYLLDNSSTEEKDPTITEISSYDWSLSTSFSPSIPEFFRPYISSLSVNAKSSITISSKNTDFSYTDPFNNLTIKTYDETQYESEWLLYTPTRRFYYPSLVTPINATITVSGTLFSWPLQKSSSPKNVNYSILLNRPDELKTDKQLEDERLQREREEKAKAGEEDDAAELAMKAEAEKKEAEDEEEDEAEKIEFKIPELEFSPQKETVEDIITYNLGYNIGYSVTDQMAYSTTNLHTSEDFKWENVRSRMYIIKLPMSLSSKINYGGNFFTVENKFSSTPVFQEHTFISTDKTIGYTEDEIKNLLLADNKAQNRDIINSNTVMLKPFLFVPVISNTSLSWNSSIKMYRRIYTGTADEISWEDKGIDWEDEECITVNTLSADVRAQEFNDKFIQSLKFDMVMPPLLKKYTVTLTLSVPDVSFAISTGFEEVKKDVVDPNEKWKKSPLNQSLNISLFNSKLKLSENYVYNIEDSNHESLRLSASMYGMQLSYLMSYVQGYDFNSDDGWKIRKDKEFLPYSFSFTYTAPSKTFYKWFNRISVAPGLNTSIVADLLRPTNSYMVFSPSIKFRINEFLDLTFSATTRNSVLYWYFHNEKGDPYSEWGGFPGNIFKDLIDSFRFDDESLRRNSGFKLKSLNMTLTHDLHDWKFNMTVKIEPRLITENGRKSYDFKPYITVGVVWNPVDSMKTTIIDEYGEWKLE